MNGSRLNTLMTNHHSRDYLIEHLISVPAFRALLRSIEAEKIASVNLPRPVLDFGCGDGNFAQMTFDEPLEAGIDPSASAIEQARMTGMYRELHVTNGLTIPYPDNSFASVLSNSVLEHIPDLDLNLSEVYRVLKPHGLFVFSTPSDHFAEYLFVPSLMRTIGLDHLGRAYENYFNRISRHYHTDSYKTWSERLIRFGFRVREWQSYFSAAAARLFDLMHYYSAPAILYKKATGRWILVPFAWNFIHLTPLFRHYTISPNCAEGAYLFFICEKD